MSVSLRERVGQIIIDYKNFKLTLSESISQILTIFPTPLTEEEIVKIIEDKLGVEKEPDLLKYNIWKQGIREIASALIGKYATPTFSGEKEEDTVIKIIKSFIKELFSQCIGDVCHIYNFNCKSCPHYKRSGK
jgi:hypothetical protein